MKIAIVHEWLVTYAGSERVLEQMLECYPEAELFALVDFLPSDKRGFIKNKPVITSFIQKLPFAKSIYRSYLPFMPLAIEQFDLSGYDLVISSSHSMAKGVLTGPDQLHLCMCYSPIRYAWDLQQQYLRESGLDTGLKGWLAKWVLHKVRMWDVRTANGVDEFVAISRFISRRIWKVYRRESKVIYPPVDVDNFRTLAGSEKKENFYVTASRMVPYKKIDLVVEAFTKMPDKKLVVIGDGPDFNKIQKIAKNHSNIELMGYQSFEVLKAKMASAKAFVFAAEEDFGIAPVEAQACGTPVIAYGKGGALETIVGLSSGVSPSGVFFSEQSILSICEAIEIFETVGQETIKSKDCRKNALRFSTDQFRKAFRDFVETEWHKFKENK